MERLRFETIEIKKLASQIGGKKINSRESLLCI